MCVLPQPVQVHAPRATRKYQRLFDKSVFSDVGLFYLFGPASARAPRVIYISGPTSFLRLYAYVEVTFDYGVATISRLLKIIRLFGEYRFLL